jgi:hypothetical protein
MVSKPLEVLLLMVLRFVLIGATWIDCCTHGLFQSGVGAVGSGLGAVSSVGGLHVPGFGNSDASADALKARATAVLKREEAAAVRFILLQYRFLPHFIISLQARVTAINARLRALGQEEWNPNTTS